MSLSDVKIKGKVVSLEELVTAKAAQREEQRLKRKESAEKKKQEVKEAVGEEAVKKPRPKKDVRIGSELLFVLIGHSPVFGCH